MKGSVRKRGAKWTVIYDEGRDENGKRLQRWKGGFATKREAEAFLASKVSSLADGSYVAPSKVTFGDHLDEWIENAAHALRPLTVTKYRGVIAGTLKPALGTVPLQALTPVRFKALYRDLRARGLAESTVAVVHAVAHRALADAVDDNLLIRNPAAIRKAAPRGKPKRPPMIWTDRERRAFLGHVADAAPRLYPLFRLAAMTGLRRGELLGLTWRAVDLDGQRLTVAQQLVPTRGGVTFGPPKSKRSRRDVALSARTVAILREHREAQLLEKAYAGSAYVDGDLVFAREDGSPIHPQTLTERHGQLVRGATVPPARFHDLRHQHTTEALTRGVPLHVVAARIGDDPKTVLATYAHLLPTSDAEAAELVEETLA